MKKSVLKEILSYTLILATFLLTVNSPVYSIESFAHEASSDEHKWYDPANEYHSGTDYSDMEYEGVDEEAYMGLIDDMKRYTAAGDAEGVTKTYDAITDALDHADTQHTLISIIYDRNVFDEENEQLESNLLDFLVEFSDASDIAIRDALNSDSVGEALKTHIDDEVLVGYFLDYEDMSEEQKKLISDFDDLTHEYDELLVGDITLEIDGKEWSFERLGNEAGSLTGSEYARIATALTEEQKRRLSEIYISVVENKNRQVSLRGYDNYADYAYENVYNRDYSTEDIRSVYEDVKKYVVPLCEEVSQRDIYNYKLANMDLSEEEKIKRVAPVIAKIDPELKEAWDYMVRHGLYDLEESDTKMETGYTIDLKDYGCAFMFDDPEGDWHDIETVIHEFGHYNNAYHVQYDIMSDGNNMDVSEIHSQGLELLALEYADELYGDACADAVKIRMISDMLETVVDACIIDEFQYRAFTYEGKLTVEKLDQIFGEIYFEYYPDQVNEEIVFAWTNISHLYHSPMYYIAYGTSALAALDILAMSLEDRQAGVDCYMNLTTYGWETGYREVLNDVGLPDIFEEGNIEDICIAVGAYVDDTSDPTFTILMTAGVFIGMIIVITGVTALIIHTRANKKRRMEEQILREYYYGNSDITGGTQ